jgi:hypothetical protein
MPTFELNCPLCGAVFEAEDEWVGQTGECSECGREIAIRKMPAHAGALQAGKRSGDDGGGPVDSKFHAVHSDSQSVPVAEMKKKVRGSFAEITEEEEWGLFRHGKTKTAIRLEEILDAYSVIDMGIVYVRKNKIDSVFFAFTYLRDCDNEISDTCINLKMRLILDGGRVLELTDVSGWESDFLIMDEKHVVKEKIQLAVPVPDMKDIAVASKIEYSIKTDSREIKGSLSSRNQLQTVKGFYNNTFDEDFELEYLYRAIR